MDSFVHFNDAFYSLLLVLLLMMPEIYTMKEMRRVVLFTKTAAGSTFLVVDAFE